MRGAERDTKVLALLSEDTKVQQGKGRDLQISGTNFVLLKKKKPETRTKKPVRFEGSGTLPLWDINATVCLIPHEDTVTL